MKRSWGRIAILDLYPFAMTEMPDTAGNLADRYGPGFYPEPCLEPGKRDLWIQSYVQTYLERDVRQLGNIRDLRAFEMFIQLSAAHHGQEFHPAQLAAGLRREPTHDQCVVQDPGGQLPGPRAAALFQELRQADHQGAQILSRRSGPWSVISPGNRRRNHC